jgi:hypothetical protein
VRTLRRLISDQTLAVPLEAGQGYLVQNGWWLHGRTRFAGQRLAWRILVEPWPIEQGIPLIEPGFAALEPTPAGTTTFPPASVPLEEALDVPDPTRPLRPALVGSPTAMVPRSALGRLDLVQWLAEGLASRGHHVTLTCTSDRRCSR